MPNPGPTPFERAVVSGGMIRPLHGIRGAAACTVGAGHYGIIKGTPSLGVVLFFVLSGFLIGKLYLGRTFDRAEVWSYVVARFARVYPLFAVVIVGVALLNATVPGADVFMLRGSDVLPHLLLVGGAMTVWTICAEFQFYAIFIAIWALRSRVRNALWVLLPVLLFSSASAVLAGSDAGRVDIFSYLHVFTLGLLIANLPTTESARTARLAGLALPSFVILYAAVFLLAPRFHAERAIYINPVALFACVGMLWASLHAGENWLNRLLSIPLAYWLGEISFGIYLLHRPAGWLVDASVGDWSGWIKMPLRIGLTLLMAQLAFMVIEKPARDAIRRWGEGRVRVAKPVAHPG